MALTCRVEEPSTASISDIVEKSDCPGGALVLRALLSAKCHNRKYSITSSARSRKTLGPERAGRGPVAPTAQQVKCLTVTD
jgi:hypothetical protein